jgi:hypothetical protein
LITRELFRLRIESRLWKFNLLAVRFETTCSEFPCMNGIGAL